MATRKVIEGFERLFAEAETAGKTAAAARVPVPMVVQELDTVTGEVVRIFPPCADGVCGFAWVTVYPGNHPFANWLKKTGKGSRAYGGGVQIWVGGYNQSMERKEAHAYAMAETLRKGGVTAYAGSRLD